MPIITKKSGGSPYHVRKDIYRVLESHDAFRRHRYNHYFGDSNRVVPDVKEEKIGRERNEKYDKTT